MGKNDNRFLTKEQELALGVKVQAMVEVTNAVKNGELISSEVEGYEEIVREGEAAIETFVENNKGLVYDRAKRWRSSFQMADNEEDVVQDGMVGLMNGILRYDPDRGNKLSTMATQWIFQSISRSAAYNSRLVRIPESRNALLSKLAARRRELAHQGASSSFIENTLREESGLSPEDYRVLMGAYMSHKSLNAPASTDEYRQSELIDVIEHEKHESAEDTIVRDEMNKLMIGYFDHLSDFDRELIARSCDIDSLGFDITEKTEREFLQEHRMSQRAARQRSAEIMSDVRRRMEEDGLSLASFLVY